MYELALFAGAGGGLLATQHLLGFKTVCYVENGPYPVSVLKARIRDGFLDDAPIWDDVRTFRQDNPECGEFVGQLAQTNNLIVTAGFPCQPFAAGGKRRGVDDPRNMWPDTVRIIGEIGPRWVFLENSPNLLYRSKKYNRQPYIEQVAGQLATLGYDARWCCLSAAALGAGHKRRRLWLVAYPTGKRRKIVLRGDLRDGPTSDEEIALASVTLESVWNRLSRIEEGLGEPSVRGVDDGLANRVGQLAAIGEGQVPIVAATAWRILTKGIS